MFHVKHSKSLKITQKQLLQKTENHYMQDNNREMHIIDAELYFVIDEKNNQIDLTDKGIEVLSQDNSDPNFFILPDIGAEIAKIESKEKDPKKEAKLKEELLRPVICNAPFALLPSQVVVPKNLLLSLVLKRSQDVALLRKVVLLSHTQMV